jgi:DNA polymerase-3 subunit beta
VNVKQFLSCIKQAAIVTTETNPGVTFKFANDGLAGGVLFLSAAGAEIGESKIDMPVDYAGEDISFRIDPGYIVDFLKILPADKNIDIYLNDKGAITFKMDDNYTYILMPLS